MCFINIIYWAVLFIITHLLGCSIAKTLIALGDSNSYDDLEIMEINSINGNIKLHVIFTYIKRKYPRISIQQYPYLWLGESCI